MALAAGLAFGAQAAPVALVADVVGAVQHHGEPLRLLAEVDAGAELTLPAGATVVVFTLAEGVQWTLAGPGRFRIGRRGPEALEGAPPPRRHAVLPAYRDLRLRGERLQQGGLVLRGHDRLVLTAPVDELVVAPAVRFVWEPLDDGTRYEFELVDAAGRKVLATATTSAAVTLPPAIHLAPGQLYYWGVRAHGAPGTAVVYRAAEFRLADEATRRRVEAARPPPDAPFAERALFVALLQDIGARSAAEDARRRMAGERPAAWSASHR